MHDYAVPKWLYLPFSKLLSEIGWWAYSLFSDFLSIVPPFSHSSYENPLSSEDPVSPRINAFCWVIFFFLFYIHAHCRFFSVYLTASVCWCLWVWVYRHMYSGMFSPSIRNRKPWLCSLTDVVATLLFRALDAICDCLEIQLSIISIIASKLQSAFKLLLILCLLVTLWRIETQRSRNCTGICCAELGAEHHHFIRD